MDFVNRDVRTTATSVTSTAKVNPRPIPLPVETDLFWTNLGCVLTTKCLWFGVAYVALNIEVNPCIAALRPRGGRSFGSFLSLTLAHQ